MTQHLSKKEETHLTAQLEYKGLKSDAFLTGWQSHPIQTYSVSMIKR